MRKKFKHRLKKGVYIGLFIILGILVQFIIHALLESLIITALVTNYNRYGLGLSWSSWWNIHSIGTGVLLLAGILVGWHQGRKWWGIIYGRH